MKYDFNFEARPIGFNTNIDEFTEETFGSFEFDDQYTKDAEFEAAKKRCKKDRCTPGYNLWIQRSLNRILGLGLKEDGDLGKNTRSAIRSFQKRQGLEPDANVGPLTEQALLAAGASAPPRIRELPCGGTEAGELIKILNKYRGNIRLPFFLAGSRLSRGLRIDSLTNLCERGFFQVHPDEAKDLNRLNKELKLDHEKLSYDPDYSVWGGIKLVESYINKTVLLGANYGFTKNSDLFWGLVKLHHWIPSAPKTLLMNMREQSVKPESWEMVRQFILSRKEYRINGRDPKDGINNVDKTLGKARIWQKKLSANNFLNQESEYGEEIGEFSQIKPGSGQQLSPALPRIPRTLFRPARSTSTRRSCSPTLCVLTAVPATTSPCVGMQCRATRRRSTWLFICTGTSNGLRTATRYTPSLHVADSTSPVARVRLSPWFRVDAVSLPTRCDANRNA